MEKYLNLASLDGETCSLRDSISLADACVFCRNPSVSEVDINFSGEKSSGVWRIDGHARLWIWRTTDTALEFIATRSAQGSGPMLEYRKLRKEQKKKTAYGRAVNLCLSLLSKRH